MARFESLLRALLADGTGLDAETQDDHTLHAHQLADGSAKKGY